MVTYLNATEALRINATPNTGKRKTLFGFEHCAYGRWTTDSVGPQNETNLLGTRREAERQLKGLAEVMGDVKVSELRVVPFQFSEWHGGWFPKGCR